MLQSGRSLIAICANRESPGGIVALVSHTDVWCGFWCTREIFSLYLPLRYESVTVLETRLIVLELWWAPTRTRGRHPRPPTPLIDRNSLTFGFPRCSASGFSKPRYHRWSHRGGEPSNRPCLSSRTCKVHRAIHDRHVWVDRFESRIKN